MAADLNQMSKQKGDQMKQLRGKVAIVTGASKGIGAAAAKALCVPFPAARMAALYDSLLCP